MNQEPEPKLTGLLKVMEQKIKKEAERTAEETYRQRAFEAKVIHMNPVQLRMAAKNYNQSA